MQPSRRTSRGSTGERLAQADHPDVGMSEGNLAIFLAEAGRDTEALPHIERSIALIEKGLGAAHPEFAMQLEPGEILNTPGRSGQARQSFERARASGTRNWDLESRSVASRSHGYRNQLPRREDNSARALPPLESAYRIRAMRETDPSKRAETSFALARALWISTVIAPGPRTARVKRKRITRKRSAKTKAHRSRNLASQASAASEFGSGSTPTLRLLAFG